MGSPRFNITGYLPVFVRTGGIIERKGLTVALWVSLTRLDRPGTYELVSNTKDDRGPGWAKPVLLAAAVAAPDSTGYFSRAPFHSERAFSTVVKARVSSTLKLSLFQASS